MSSATLLYPPELDDDSDDFTPPPGLPPFIPQHLATKPRPLPTSPSVAGVGSRTAVGAGRRRVSGPFVEREDDVDEGEVVFGGTTVGAAGKQGVQPHGAHHGTIEDKQEQDEDEEAEEESEAEESDRSVLGGGTLLRESPKKKKTKAKAPVASGSSGAPRPQTSQPKSNAHSGNYTGNTNSGNHHPRSTTTSGNNHTGSTTTLGNHILGSSGWERGSSLCSSSFTLGLTRIGLYSSV
jgi:ribosomal protein L12E/L44/L45/RPP1/RPP2